MKIVKESIDDILKPKSKEDIIKNLKNINIPSYNLKSYFKLINSESEKHTLKSICKNLNILPEDMEITMSNNLFTDSFLKPLFNYEKYIISSYTITDTDNINYPSSIYYNKTFNVNEKFKVIQIKGFYYRDSYSYIYPKSLKNNISSIL